MLSYSKLKTIEAENSPVAVQDQEAFLKMVEEMKADQVNSDNQRKAIFNILEDIDESQEQLKKRYGELNVIKQLVQDLGKSLQTKAVMNTLIAALEKTFSKEVVFSFVIPMSDPGMFSKLMYIHAGAPLGKKYLDDIKQNIELSFDLLPNGLKRKKELTEWIHKKFMYEFIKGEGNESDNKRPLSIFNAPLIVRDEMLGVVNISSPVGGLFTEKDISLANTMVGITANTISRLRQLLESEQSRTQSLVEGLSNGVIMFDLDKRVTMSNLAAQKMTGLPSKGFYLSELIRLIEVQDKNKIEQNILEMLDTGKIYSFDEIKVSRFIYEVIINPVRDNDNNIVGGAVILHDVTHIKEIDRMKTEFVSVASHQLRTPLTAIKLFVEMLLDGSVGNMEIKQRQYIENVQHSAERMIHLVNDLLNVSRIETGRLRIDPKPTDMQKFIQSVIDESSPVLEDHKCKIVFKKLKPKLPKIPVDQTLVQQVVHNLIANAVRYSSDDKCGIMVELKKEKDNYLISVRDSGIGIPPAVQPQIFQKFFRADNAQKKETEGSGLGLYVAKMIVEASGGKIWFESEDGKGTTFFFTLPTKGVPARAGEKGLIMGG